MKRGKGPGGEKTTTSQASEEAREFTFTSSLVLNRVFRTLVTSMRPGYPSSGESKPTFSTTFRLKSSMKSALRKMVGGGEMKTYSKMWRYHAMERPAERKRRCGRGSDLRGSFCSDPRVRSS